VFYLKKGGWGGCVIQGDKTKFSGNNLLGNERGESLRTLQYVMGSTGRGVSCVSVKKRKHNKEKIYFLRGGKITVKEV